MAPHLDPDVELKELRKPSMDRVAAIERLHIAALDRGPIARAIEDLGLRASNKTVESGLRPREA